MKTILMGMIIWILYIITQRIKAQIIKQPSLVMSSVSRDAHMYLTGSMIHPHKQRTITFRDTLSALNTRPLCRGNELSSIIRPTSKLGAKAKQH